MGSDWYHYKWIVFLSNNNRNDIIICLDVLYIHVLYNYHISILIQGKDPFAQMSQANKKREKN